MRPFMPIIVLCAVLLLTAAVLPAAQVAPVAPQNAPALQLEYAKIQLLQARIQLAQAEYDKRVTALAANLDAAFTASKVAKSDFDFDFETGTFVPKKAAK